jgi:hypothetical protein
MQRWNFNLFLVQQFQNVFFQFNFDGGKTIKMIERSINQYIKKSLEITMVIICITVKLTDVDSCKECKY